MSTQGLSGGGFNYDTQAGIAHLLASVRSADISTEQKNDLRDTIFLYTNGGRDQTVCLSLEQKITSYGVVPVGNVPGSSQVSPMGFSRSAPGNFSVSAPTPPQPAPVTPPQTTPVVPQPAPASITPLQSTPTPTPQPDPVPVTPVPASQPAPSPITQTPQSAPAPVTPSTSQPVAVGHDPQVFLVRIREIKSLVNQKIGNPVNLVDINNEVGREYMGALLDAMKKINSGASAVSAMQRLESAFLTVEKTIADHNSDQIQPLAPAPVTPASQSAPAPVPPPQPVPVQPTPVPVTPVPASQPAPTPITQTPQSAPAPISKPQDPRPVPVPPTPKPEPVIPVPASPTPKPMPPSQPTPIPKPLAPPILKPQPLEPKAAPVTQFPRPEPVRKVFSQSQPPAPKSESVPKPVQHMEKESFTPFQEESVKEKTPESKPKSIPEINNEEKSEKPESHTQKSKRIPLQDIPNPAEKKSEVNSEYESEKDEARWSNKNLPNHSESISNVVSLADKLAGDEKSDKPQQVNVPKPEADDSLHTPEIEEGLNQLLAEWSLFKKSGLFGTGPKGKEHPLFKKVAGLQIPLLLAGRFEGATQEIKQSITDYMNGWRYEQGIIYTQGETFESYLRRVIKHILDLQKKKTPA